MNVLLLTDYSELSSFMRDVADNIATKTNWNLKVLNVVNIPSELTKIDHENIDMKCASDPLVYVEQRALSIEKMEAFTSGMKANKETFVYYGGILDTIIEFVEEQNIDLIAMGTVYSRGLKNFFNNTLLETIVKEIDVPVLSLKCNRSNAAFSDIMLYCDFEYVNDYDFNQVKAIQDAFGSKLHLIHISEGAQNNDAILSQMKVFAEKHGVKPDYIELIHAKSKEEAVIKYIEEYEASGKGNIDLIGVQKRLRNELGKFFLGSVAAKFVNKINRPIITVTKLKEK